MPEVPDSISFSDLRKLHSDKGSRLDFSSPAFSPDIGDLAFFITTLLNQKFEGIYTHHQVFLADILVTNLRCSYEEQLKKRGQAGADYKEIEVLAKIASHLLTAEGLLDGLVSLCMKKMGAKGTLPSYRLVKSMDPTVKPHEIEEWVRGLNDPN